jgi:hypothetical protein
MGMKAHDSSCCRRLSKRRGWAAGGATFAAGVALIPKCPLCAAAWLGVLGLSGLTGTIDGRAVWLAIALVAAACSTLAVQRFFTWKET